ncbi:DUF982 domain-containing protein [Devosia sp. ZB163]|uniref:DUF982 domain-containing protein n=1 Tax=Devosia sp. ZB163 TaxID=3025938 RepID=UPI0023606694|nr:DUF982 domain-containing protein [Devosia sp. ZB163]MDC9822760.1 DUF982 domain-containing protein [Devosia sp. ZB163]
MANRPFSQPVSLRLHHAGSFQARSACEAHEYLDLHWPAARTAHYRQAKALCESAIEGLVDAEVARRAVIDAARRAGLLATKRQVDGHDTNTSYVAVANGWQWPSQTAEDDDVSDSDLVGYWRAADIVEDPALSPSRKKALLSYWASDVHAVSGAPSLRCARGVTVTIDSLFEAMARLDNEIDQAAMLSGPSIKGRSW